MTNATRNLIDTLEKRLQLLITISILFPSLVYNFFLISGAVEYDANEKSFSFVSLIVSSLVNYVFFECIKGKMKTWAFLWISRLLLVELVLFIVPITIFLQGDKPMNLLSSSIFIGSLYALLIVPAIIFIIFIIELYRIVGLFDFVKNIFKRIR